MISQVYLIVAVSFVSLSFAQDSSVPTQTDDKNSDAQFHVAKGYYFTKGVSTDGAKHADGSMYLSGHFVEPSLSFGGGDSGWTAPATSTGGWTATTPTVGWTAPTATVGWSAPTNLGWTAPATTGSYAIWAPNWDIWNTASYCVAVIAAVASIWYVCSVVGTWGGWGVWGTPTGGKKSSTVAVKESDEEAEESKDKVEDKKTRRRRSVEAEADLNRLSSLVLSAIESGECLQKTICLFGSQIGTRQGRVASMVLDKMLPPSVQSNTYFITFKKALKGEVYCQKFKCKH